MLKICRQLSLFMLLLLPYSQVVWAAPMAPNPVAVPVVQEKEDQPALQSIRYSFTPQKVRIVFNVTTLPVVTSSVGENPDQLLVNFDGLANQVSTAPLAFNDQVVTGLQLSEVEADKQQVVISLNKAVTYKIFTLANPNRVVMKIKY